VFTDVAGVVKQRGDDREAGEFGAKGVVARALTFVAVDDARQRQRHVQRVLFVVIESVAAVIAFKVAFKQVVEIIKGAADIPVVGVVVAAVKDIADGIAYRLGIRNLNAIGDIKFRMAVFHEYIRITLYD
jgi:hypothetical protein